MPQALTREQIYAVYSSKLWTADSGLGRLDPFPEDSQIFGDTESVHNENGLYFKSIFELVSHLAGCKTSANPFTVNAIIRSLEASPGVLNRWANYSLTEDAQDNDVGGMILSRLYGLDFPSRALLALRKVGSLNNRTGKWSLRTMRQGGDYALYAACNDEVPDLANWIWFLGGILMNAFKGSPSDSILAWGRLWAVKDTQNNFTPIQALTFYPVLAIWRARKKSIGQIFKQYYRPEHPIHQMAEFLTGIGF